ncbi:hypothetical protein K435DRAFT_742569, partial [Dendrothele bispora CBS 962.96]
MDGDLKKQYDSYRSRISSIDNEDDPLAVYVEFVQWTINNNDPNSELPQLLKEATKAFDGDATYKSDLRYLKLWIQYAHRSKFSTLSVFGYLYKHAIGTSYSLLYEEYANVLEKNEKISEADAVYRKGVQNQARPIERLKSKYAAFRSRISSPSSSAPSTSSSSQKPSDSSSTTPASSTAESRYAVMLAAVPPRKRTEKLNFDFSLLYTPENGEYCIEEARTKSMGLLRKKWPILPPNPPKPAKRRGSSSSSSSRDDDQTDPNRNGTSRRKSLYPEPTVTINTREALNDVFGMYNSPEKTIKLAAGSKHLPVRRVSSITPNTLSKPTTAVSQNAGGFQPFVDENANSNVKRKENKPAPAPRKFTPFVDLNSQKTAAPASRSAFSIKEAPARQNENEKKRPFGDSGFSKVFAPEPREATSQDIPQPKPKAVFTPFVDENSGAPFKVFSRPTETENVFASKERKAFAPLAGAKSPFTPFQDPAPSKSMVEQGDEQDDRSQAEQHVGYEEGQSEEYDDDYDDEGDFVVDLPPEEEYQQEAAYEEEQSFGEQEVPLGGRFGKFNVMTPITERTFEYTATRSVQGSPSALLRHIPENPEEEMLVQEENEEDETAQNDNENDSRHVPFKLVPQSQREDSSLNGLEQSTSKLTLAESLARSASFRPPNPCNPFDPPIINTLLSTRIHSDKSFFDLRDQECHTLEELQKFAKKSRVSNGGRSSGGNVGMPNSHSLNLAGQRFNVLEKLGEGGFGSVFKAKDKGSGDQDDDLDDDDMDDWDDLDLDEENSSIVALKVVKPRNLWEYHVLRRVHNALPPSCRRYIILPHALYAFKDESYLVLDFCSQGSLLDIVNGAETAGVSQQGACLDELLVMFFTIELMKLLEALHNAGFIHGDLKIDNCLLRLDELSSPSEWASNYSPSGEQGWGAKGLKLIDFGRTIDTKLFPSDQQFIAEWETDERDCFEIREGRPWTYQTDYFGLLSIIYCMFWGKYIQASSLSKVGERYKVTTPLKRYWQTVLWTRLFDVLLNPGMVREDGSMPVSEELGMIRKEMEEWLKANCNRTSGTLKGLLRKVEMYCLRQ